MLVHSSLFIKLIAESKIDTIAPLLTQSYVMRKIPKALLKILIRTEKNVLHCNNLKISTLNSFEPLID